jgi:hypothetical protein
MKGPKEFRKFEAVEDDQVVYVATTAGGHTAGIGNEPVEVHPSLHRLAMLEGATPEGTREKVRAQKEADSTEPNNQNRTKDDIIIDAVAKVFERATQDADAAKTLLTGDGRPDVKAVSDIAGMKITAAERDAAWEQYQNEAS